jgi:voltage-gated potassium channel
MTDRLHGSDFDDGAPRKVSASGRLLLAPEVPPPKRDPLAKPMFWFAAVQLIFYAGLIHRYPYPSVPEWEKLLILAGWLGLAGLIVVEGIYRLVFLAEGSRRGESIRLLLTAIFPPARMGAPSLIRRGQIYLPGMGWRDLNERLEVKLAARLRLPMVFFALLILPLLALEYIIWVKPDESPTLRVILDVGSAVIWVAFAVDFVLGISVAVKKMKYFIRHMLDFFIVVIPMFQFALTHVADLALAGRLARLTRMARLYQLRTMPLKAWQALVALEVVNRLIHHALMRLFGIDPLQRRRRMIDEEIADLDRQRVRLYEERIDLDKKIAAREAVRREEGVT